MLVVFLVLLCSWRGPSPAQLRPGRGPHPDPSHPDPSHPHRRRRPSGGQATAEYALVLLGVATVALLLAAWAARSGKIGQLFDAVVDQLITKVG